MPTHDFICQYCGWTTVQYALKCGHVCPKNKSTTLTELIRLDDPTVRPVDVCCDGCDAERLGAEHHTYTEKLAKAFATEAGWICQGKRDWCPRCAAEKKVTASSVELAVSLAFIAFVVTGALYAFSNRPIVYRDESTGRYIIPRSKKAPYGRRHHDVD